jgi:PAS domain S-box-containing protein
VSSRGAWSLRRVGLLVLSATAAYLLLVTVAVIARFTPEVVRLRRGTAQGLALIDAVHAREEILERVRHALEAARVPSHGGVRGPTQARAFYAALRAALDTTAQVPNWVPLQDVPEAMRLALVSASDLEDHLFGVLARAEAALELGNAPLRDAYLADADGMAGQVRAARRTIDSLVLADLGMREQRLVGAAGLAARIILWWALAGLAVVPALLWLLYRRLLKPLEDLDRGLSRLSGGDLAVEFAVRADDELGRIARQLNVSTRVLREQAARDRQQVQESERARLAALSPNLLSTTTVSGTWVAVNPAAERVLGWSAEELVGTPFAQLLHPDDQATAARDFARVQRGEPVRSSRVRLRRKDGGYCWLEWDTDPPEGGLVYSVARDVTSEVEAAARAALLEAEVRRSEQRYRAFVQHSSEGIWRDEIDPPLDTSLSEDEQIAHLLDHSRVAEANDAMARMYGYPDPSGLVGLPLKHFLDPGDPRTRDYLRRYIESGYRVTDAETWERDRTGSLRVFLNNLWGVVEDGHLVRTWGTLRDVTEKRQAEQLQAAVYDIAQAAERAADLDTLYECVHQIIRGVMSARNFYIAALDAATGTVSFPYFVDECDAPPAPRRDGRGLTEYALRTGRPLLCTRELGRELERSGEIEPIGSDSQVWVGVPLKVEGEVLGVMAVQDYRDPAAYGERELKVLEFVSSQVAQAIRRRQVQAARERLQEDVRRSAVEWRRTFDALESPVLLVDSSGAVLRLNQAARDLSGRSYRFAVGKRLGEIGTGEPWRSMAQLVERVMATATGSFSQVRDLEKGRTFDLALSPVPGGEAGPPMVIVVARDVTRLVELQDELRRSETMSAMGSLVAGVAHEVRNPLFSMTACLDAFEARHGVREEYRQHLGVLRTQLDRLTRLMQDLLEYGKPPSSERVRVGLHEVIAEAVEACSAQASQARVGIERRIPEVLPPVEVDRLRMVQVFANLLENAVQHSPARSTVTIEVTKREAVERSWVECVVSDSGPGFAADDLEQVFQPFFSRRRGGTGLGLSIVQRIVEQHGGQVAPENRPEGGGLVRVRLPAISG